MGVNDFLIGTQKTVDDINQADIRLRKSVEQVSGKPFTSQMSSSIIRNKKLIIWQVKGLPDKYTLPDLTMKINPKNLDAQYTQLINRKRTLGGFIEEHWGEQLDSLSASGQTSQFYGPTGLTNEGRRDTDGFKSFEKFVAIYRNNGTLYDEKTGKIISQGFVVMNYDDAIYNGYFESFNIQESDQKQFELEYDFTFKVTKEVYPGRIQSFKNVTTVLRPGVKNDRVALDITGVQQ